MCVCVPCWFVQRPPIPDPPSPAALHTRPLRLFPPSSLHACVRAHARPQALLAWDQAAATAALAVLRASALPCLARHGGYLVEDCDGLLLVAFSSARQGLLWALECQELAKELPW